MKYSIAYLIVLLLFGCAQETKPDRAYQFVSKKLHEHDSIHNALLSDTAALRQALNRAVDVATEIGFWNKYKNQAGMFGNYHIKHVGTFKVNYVKGYIETSGWEFDMPDTGTQYNWTLAQLKNISEIVEDGNNFKYTISH
jgi:hypothetical protein